MIATTWKRLSFTLLFWLLALCVVTVIGRNTHAQQPAPAINPDILTMQRNAAFDDNARLMTMLTAERAAAAALEKYWRDACQSTPECGGTPAKVGDNGLKPVIGQMN